MKKELERDKNTEESKQRLCSTRREFKNMCTFTSYVENVVRGCCHLSKPTELTKDSEELSI